MCHTCYHWPLLWCCYTVLRLTLLWCDIMYYYSAYDNSQSQDNFQSKLPHVHVCKVNLSGQNVLSTEVAVFSCRRAAVLLLDLKMCFVCTTFGKLNVRSKLHMTGHFVRPYPKPYHKHCTSVCTMDFDLHTETTCFLVAQTNLVPTLSSWGWRESLVSADRQSRAPLRHNA